VERTPVWFMRQAGRYQPQYRRLRERLRLLEICERPDVCTEVTLLPVQELGVDAAILFSDITVPLRAVGIGLDIVEGVGPVVSEPLRTADDLGRVRTLVPDEDEPYVAEAVRQIVAELRGVPLIGFAGGPFTLASYLVEGGPSRSYRRLKGLMWQDPKLFGALLERLADMTERHLAAQANAGAGALQIFDSWIGCLSPGDYRRHVLPVMQRLFRRLGDLKVPTIYFGVETAGLLDAMAESGADVIGVDWRVDIRAAADRIGPELAIQGNLDPALLLAPEDEIAQAAKAIVRAMDGRRGHIFNLGHGVLPETPPDALRRLVEIVRQESLHA
jgi:uroporphyrinogen decarboxylase